MLWHFAFYYVRIIILESKAATFSCSFWFENLKQEKISSKQCWNLLGFIPSKEYNFTDFILNWTCGFH